MLEFNQWYLVLVANFIILFLALRVLLFKPLADNLKQRDELIKKNLNEAHKLLGKKESVVGQVHAELNAARSKAKDTFNALKEEGMAKQKEVMSRTEAEAVAQIEKGRAELQSEADKARAALKGDLEKFSEEIVKKLVRV